MVGIVAATIPQRNRGWPRKMHGLPRAVNRLATRSVFARCLFFAFPELARRLFFSFARFTRARGFPLALTRELAGQLPSSQASLPIPVDARASA